MNIICCYNSGVHPKTVESLSAYAPTALMVETPGLYGYQEAIAARWQGVEDLVVIEADKEITAETIPSFETCREPWCTHACETLPPPYTKTTTNSLACARFTVNIQRIVDPNEFLGPDVPWQPCRHCDSKGCWNQLDVRMAMAFQRHGIQPHVHGEVTHHHDYDSAWWQEWKKDWDYLMDVQARTQEIFERAQHVN